MAAKMILEITDGKSICKFQVGIDTIFPTLKKCNFILAALLGMDFFNWTGRCLSTGNVFNPYKVSLDSYNDCSSEHRHSRCEVGDLVNKVGLLNVAGRKQDLKNTVKYFTDSNLPLSGLHSIIGKSLVLFDDHAPQHRGDRMACTPILRKYRHKTVAK
jgi:hypothetical protein